MTCPSLTATLLQPAVRQPARVTGFGGWLKRIAKARALHRQRRQLALLDAARLEDIGLSQTEARREADRPFWDAPSYWR